MNNSNKTLLQILVETLPKVGGWPEGVAAMAQDADGAVQNYRDTKDIIIDGEYARGTSRISYSYSIGIDEVAAASDRLTAIITRDQYEAALAASKELRPYQVSTGYYGDCAGEGKTIEATGADGWIEWAGGECPVDSDAIVEVKYRKPSPYQLNNDRAGDFTWSHDGSGYDIIVYRLPHPHEVKAAGIDVQRDEVKSNDAQLEADLNECIGQPQEDIKTIRAEMLAVLNDTRLTMNLRAAMKLVDAFIDAGYRKQ